MTSINSNAKGLSGIWAGCLQFIRQLHWQTYFLLILSFPFALYILWNPLYFGYSDSQGYLRFAKFLVSQDGGMLFPDRSPVPSILLILTGVLHLNTWWIFRISMVLMGMAMPLMVYDAVRIYSSRITGLMAGILTVASGVPFLYASTYINPDHLSFFSTILMVYLVAVYLRQSQARPNMPYIIALVSFASCLTRPTIALVFWIFIACAFFYTKSNRKQLLLASFLHLCLMGLWTYCDMTYWTGRYSPRFMPASIQERVFAEVYFDAGTLQFVQGAPLKPAIRPGDGKYSVELYAILKEYLQKYPEQWIKPTELRPALLFGKYSGNEEQLVAEIMAKPNGFYFDFLRLAITAKKGTEAKDFMKAVAREHHNTGILRIIRYFVKNPSKLFLGGETTGAGGARNTLSQIRGIKTRSHFFFNFHHLTNNSMTVSLFSPANGYSSRELYNAAAMLFRMMPTYWETNPAWSKFAGSPEKIHKEFFAPENGVIHEEHDGTLLMLFTHYYGYKRTEQIFRGAVSETLKVYPNGIFIIIDNFLNSTVLKKFGEPTDQWNGKMVLSWARSFVYPGKYNDFNFMSEGLKRELVEKIPDQWLAPLAIMNGIFIQFTFIIVIMATLSFGFCLLTGAHRFVVFLALSYLSIGVIVAVGSPMAWFRYDSQYCLLPMMIGVMGCFWAIQGMRQHRGEIFEEDQCILKKFRSRKNKRQDASGA